MSRRRSFVVIALALGALAVAWRALPGASPPVYDGLCFTDPYRVLGASPAPESATKTYADTTTSPFIPSEILTNENPPQATLIMTDGTFVSPGSPFTVGIAPVPAPAIKPHDGQLDGNVYRLTAMTASGTPLTPKQPITIVLRATGTNPSRTLERFDGTTWSPLQTFFEGCGDSFEATTDRTADFAMVISGQSPSTPGGGPPIAAIIAGAVVVLVAAVLLIVRVSRTRARR